MINSALSCSHTLVFRSSKKVSSRLIYSHVEGRATWRRNLVPMICNHVIPMRFIFIIVRIILPAVSLRMEKKRSDALSLFYMFAFLLEFRGAFDLSSKLRTLRTCYYSWEVTACLNGRPRRPLFSSPVWRIRQG